MTYYTKHDYVMIRRHWIMMFFRYLKFSFYSFTSIVFYFIAVKFRYVLGAELINYIVLPLSFILINYAFIKLILYYIGFYNNILIFYNDMVIVIKSTLLDTDNVEIIDLHKITKIDAYSYGIFANIFGYGTLVIEQQRDKVREFWYVPKPYKAIGMLNDLKERSLEKKEIKK